MTVIQRRIGTFINIEAFYCAIPGKTIITKALKTIVINSAMSIFNARRTCHIITFTVIRTNCIMTNFEALTVMQNISKINA